MDALATPIMTIDDRQRRIEQIHQALAPHFGNRLTSSQSVREQHASQITWHGAQLPDAVVFAQSTAEVQRVVAACAEHRVPIVPFGTGTSMEGHINAPFGGLSLDLSGLDRIIAVRADDMDCTVEAGVTRLRLNQQLRDVGLFFSVDPGADASLGGMAATRASGTNSVRYGTMRDNVVAMKVVTADGAAILTGSRARKSAAGYDLTRLFVGSEGTLGIITELTLRLSGIPDTIAGGVCHFNTVAGACRAAIAAIQSGLSPARIELLDEIQMQACALYSKLPLPAAPTLFFEFHGTPAAVAEQIALFRDIAAENGGGDVQAATDANERNRLWKARHDAFWAAKAYRPGRAILVTDICVPIASLAACVEETRADMNATGLEGPITGHVGDGNFHVGLFLDPADAGERKVIDAFTTRLARRAIAMDGTCTGEHGVGQGKIHHVEEEMASALPALRALKQALDPLGIFNPGKMLRPSS